MNAATKVNLQVTSNKITLQSAIIPEIQNRPPHFVDIRYDDYAFDLLITDTAHV